MFRKVMTMMCAALAVAFAGIALASTSSEEYEFVRAWGETGCGPGQFGSDQGPQECTFDRDGHLYVADYGCNRIQKFSASGDPSMWGGYLDGWSVGWIFGLEFSEGDGYLYFSNTPGEIGRITTDGVLQWTRPVTSAFWQTHGIDVDCRGHIRVCENYLAKIYEYDRDGIYLSAWNWPDPVEPNAQEIATDFDGDLWIREGSRIAEHGCDNSATGRQIDAAPDEIRAVTVDDCGNIYIGMQPSGLVRKYGSDLTLLAEWGGHGSGQGEFEQIRGIAVQGCGENVAVSDSGNYRIQIFRRRGIADRCPCEGPVGSTGPWRNHGKYVSCVALAANDLLEQGVVTEDEKDRIVSDAAQSECGRR